MADTELTGKVVLTADATAAKREIDKLAGPDAQRAGEGFSSRFGTGLEQLTRKRLGRFAGALGPLGQVAGRAAAGGARAAMPAASEDGTLQVQVKQQRAGVGLAGVLTLVGARLRFITGGLRNMGSAVKVVTNRLNMIGPERQLTQQRLLTGRVAGAGGPTAAPGRIGLGGLALRVAGIGLVIGGLGLALKVFTGRVLGFGRTLAQSSGITAAAFARFDARMFRFTNRLGNRLGPAFDRALTKITDLLVSNEELIGGALTGLVSVLGFFVSSVDIAAKNLQGAGRIPELLEQGELSEAIKRNTKATQENTDARMGGIDAPERVLPELLQAIRAGAGGGVVPIGGVAAPIAADQGQLPDLLRDLLAQQEEDRQRVVDQEKDQVLFR